MLVEGGSMRRRSRRSDGSGGPTDTASEQAESSRDRILDAAEQLFAESGYDGTPTTLIAERAEVPKGLVFHYFPTKIDVLVAVVAERTRMDRLRTLPIEPVAGDVAQTLTRLAERFRADGHISPALRRIIFREASTHPEVGRRLTQLHSEALRRVRAAIDAALEGHRDGVPAQPQRDIAAAAFASAMLHDLNLNQLTGGKLDLSGIARLVARGLQGPALAVS
jgi:AcrR family transcriptional regulator